LRERIHDKNARIIRISLFVQQGKVFQRSTYAKTSKMGLNDLRGVLLKAKNAQILIKVTILLKEFYRKDQLLVSVLDSKCVLSVLY